MRTQARSRRDRRPGLELLEPRLVLSTIFVDPTGNDANRGTSSAPLLSLQKASKVAMPGDTVDVRAGNYVGFVMGWDAPQGGKPVAPITFHAEPDAVITSRNNKTPDGIDLEGASYVTIEGFKVVNMNRAGIRSNNGTNVVIRNNVCDSNARWGIMTSHDENVLIEGNTTSNSKIEHGIYVSNSADSPTIRDNIVFSNAGNGIHINGDASQGGDGIISDALIEGNIIYNNGVRGGSAINLDGLQDSVIRNNLIYNNHASGISLYRIDGGGPSTNNLIENNTIVMAADSKFPLNIQNGSTGNVAFNNILLATNSRRLASVSISTDSLPGFMSDNNALMSKQTTDGYTLMSLAAWQSQTGQDAHSFATTPAAIGFVNPTAADYHLSSTSPAVDAGTVALPPAKAGSRSRVALHPIAKTDLDGSPRVWGRSIDIGAYEFHPTHPSSGTATGKTGASPSPSVSADRRVV